MFQSKRMTQQNKKKIKIKTISITENNVMMPTFEGLLAADDLDERTHTHVKSTIAMMERGLSIATSLNSDAPQTGSINPSTCPQDEEQ